MKSPDFTSETIVRRHLNAVWASDWDLMKATAAPDGRFLLRSGMQKHVHSATELYGFYRHVSQAWDFLPGHVHLAESADGKVSVRMELTNGADWTKIVAGQYLVSNGVIDCIELVDTVAEQVSNG